MMPVVVEAREPQPAEQPVARCHVCGSPHIAFFANMSDNGHLRRADIRLPVYRCRMCDVFFLNPPPPASIGREYFAQAYAKSGNNLYYDDSFKERVSDLRLQMLKQYGFSSGLLLDVGCGKGQFVHAARRRGWDAWGAELDEGACRYARQRFGLDTVVCGSITDAALPPAFGVITLWDVIEHVPNPVRVLRDACGRLAEAGLIVVRTGNIRSWAFDRNRRKWWAFGSDHRFYFSPASLSYALEEAGFRVLDVLNQELVERPGKRRPRDIGDTRLSDGLRAVGHSPAKLAKAGAYARQLTRRSFGRLRYGTHYDTSIMTVIAAKRGR